MKWEYLVYKMNPLNEDVEQKLAAHGFEGWELITLYHYQSLTHLVFKRPLKP